MARFASFWGVLALGCTGEPIGPTCGAGTSLSDGECVPTIQLCGEGTVLVGGECVPAEEACGAGTVLVVGECVPAEEACGAGTALVGGECVFVPVLSHFSVDVAPADCDVIVGGREVDLTVTAVDTAGQPLTTYGGSVDLLGVGVAVTPSTLGGFVGGVATGSFELHGVSDGVRVAVADSSGAGGTSSTFDVVAELLTPTASVAAGPVRAGAPFDLTITLASNACDTPDVDGMVALSALLSGATVTPANTLLSGTGPYVVEVRVDGSFATQQTVAIEVDVDGQTDTVDVDVAPPIAFAGVQYAWGLASDGRATWQPAGGGTGTFDYDVFVATSPGAQDFGDPDATTTGASIALPGLTPGLPHFLVVRARDGIDDGDDDNTVETSLLLGDVLFVDDDNAGGTEDGGAATPFSTITQALDEWAARLGTAPVASILVAEGDYPDLPLALSQGERLLGGFVPGATPALWEAGGTRSRLTNDGSFLPPPAVLVDSDDVLLDGFELPADLQSSGDLVRVAGASSVALRNVTLASAADTLLRFQGAVGAATNVATPCQADRPYPPLAVAAAGSAVRVRGLVARDCQVAVSVEASLAILIGLDVARTGVGVSTVDSTVLVEDSQMVDVDGGVHGERSDVVLRGFNAIEAGGTCVRFEQARSTWITGGAYHCGDVGIYHRTGDDGRDFILDAVDLRSGSWAFEVHHEGAPTYPGFVQVLDSTFESDGAFVRVGRATPGEPVEIEFLNDTFDLDRRGVEVHGQQEADLLVHVGGTTFRGGREAQLRVVDSTALGATTGVVESVFEHGNTAFSADLPGDGAEPHLAFLANVVTGMNEAVVVSGGSASGSPHVTVEGNTLDDAGGGVVVFLPLEHGSGWASIAGNEFQRVDRPVFVDASVVDGEAWIEVADNQAEGAWEGIVANTHANDGRMRLDVRDNHLGGGDPFGTGILLRPRAGQGTHAVNVRDNTVEGSGTGIRVEPFAERSGVLPVDVRDNRVERAGETGVLVESRDGEDPSEAPFAGAVVAGNTVIGAGATGLRLSRQERSDALITSLVVDNDVRDAGQVGIQLGGGGSGRARALTAEGNRAWGARTGLTWDESQADGTRVRLLGNDVAGAWWEGIATALSDSSDGRVEVRGNTVTGGGGMRSWSGSVEGSTLAVSHNLVLSNHGDGLRIEAPPGSAEANTFEVVNNTVWSGGGQGVRAFCPDDPLCTGTITNNLIGDVSGPSLSVEGSAVTTAYNLVDADEITVLVDTNFAASPTFVNAADTVVAVTDPDVDARTFVQDGPGPLQVGDKVVVHGEGVVRDVLSVTPGALPWVEIVEVGGPPLDVAGETALVFGWHPADFVSAVPDYGLASGSRGIDEGDPAILDDADGSRSDVGHTGGHTDEAVGSSQACLDACTDDQDAAYADCLGTSPICDDEPFVCDQREASALHACRLPADVDLSTCVAGCVLAGPAGWSTPRVHLPFDGDLSNVGSLGGTATGAPSGYATDRCGRSDGAGSFATNTVETPAVNMTGGSATFAVWIRTSDVTGNDGVLAHPNISGGHGGFLLQIGRFSSVFTCELYGVAPATFLPFGAASDDAWHQIVTTVDATSGVHRLYLDGVEVGQRTGATATNSIRNTPIYVGRLRDVAGSYTGLIDDVRIYDVGMSPEEVAALYSLESTVCQ